MRVTRVVTNDDYTMLVTFSSGERKLFDVKPYLSDSFWAPLKNISKFKQAEANGITVTWDEKIDFCPDEIYDNGVVA